MLVFKVTAESPSAAKAIAMSGEVEDAYQEARPVSADDLPNTDNWIVEEVSDWFVKELRLEQDQSSGLWVVKKGKWRVGQYAFSDKKKAEEYLKQLEKGKK